MAFKYHVLAIYHKKLCQYTLKLAAACVTIIYIKHHSQFLPKTPKLDLQQN